MNGIGIDVIEIKRVESAINRWGERFLERIYTGAEIDICGGRSSSLAALFAAKEAVMKVLGTGAKGVSWREIEILADVHGKPVVKLYGRAKDKARELNLNELHISLSDTKQLAFAAVIGT